MTQLTVPSTRVMAVGARALGLLLLASTPIFAQRLIQCPAAPQVVESLDGQPTPVEYPPALATGQPLPVIVTYSRQSGDLFPVGSTTVTATARWKNGMTLMCPFAVTVTYTLAPVACVTSPFVMTSAGAFTACTISGTQTRTETWTRTVLTPASNGGLACGPLTESRTGSQACVVTPPPPPPPSGIGNAYFDTILIPHPKWWWGYSLRPQPNHPLKTDPYYSAQLLRPGLGGWTGGNNLTTYRGVTYDPVNDPDVHTQDAAKLTIPAFALTPGTWPLTQAASATDLVIHFAGASSGYYTRSLKLDSEITGKITAYDTVAGTVTVASRGAFGTLAEPHAIGTPAIPNGNSLQNNITIPLAATDGHTYFCTWDGYWTDSYIRSGLTNHKAWNFLDNGIWIEPDANYGGGTGQGRVLTFNKDTDVAAYQVRAYNGLSGPTVWDATLSNNRVGPGTTAVEPLSPQLHTFTIKPNRWTRFWTWFDMRATDYDSVSTWIADEVTDAALIHDRLLISGRAGHSIESFHVEFNTSTDAFVRGTVPAGLRDLVAYTRNSACLRDVTAADITPLLQRPVK